MNTKLFCAAAVLLLACGIAAVSAAPGAMPSVPRYGKFEASFTLPNQTGNPFDPADNDVQVLFTGPSRQVVATPAFWDGDRWRVRYAPLQIGMYTLVVKRGGTKIAPKDLTSARFRCTASSAPGFVKRDPQTAQRFVFGNGRTYYPLGMNVAWTGDKTGSTPEIFQKMGAVHMNWARVWMTFWDGKALDWSPDKSKNPARGQLLLSAARKWDAIFEAAEQNGVYVQMTLQHHGQYTEKTDPNWADNPFSTKNGGFLARPDDFFTDPEARRLTRAKYRYVAARWGYSPHLLSYELFNEVQNIGEAKSHFADVVAWHQEMAATLRSIDVNHHLITTSYTSPGEPLSQIGLDYDQPHEYTGDLISYFASLKGGDKPLFTGEWGPSDTKTGMTEQMLHDGLWASLQAPTAGSGQFWYWDNVIPNKWWPQFASATDFQRRLGLREGDAAMTRVHPHLKTSGALSDLAFAPGGGWSTATRDTVSISSGGEAPDMSGIPSFIQGTNHRDMLPKPVTLVLDCPSPCRLTVDLGTVAKAGAHPTLTLDGPLAAEADFPATAADHEAGRSLTVELTAGPHRAALFNTGTDWVVVPKIVISRYAPPVAILAKGNTRRVVFWAYNRDRSGSTPAEATLRLDTLGPLDTPGPGVYTAHLWDCWTGRALPDVPAVRLGNAWEIALPNALLARDVAGVVEEN